VPGPTYDQARLEQAIDALAEPGRLREAESLVAGSAPRLQQVLVQALEAGGWFGEAHEGEVQKAASIEDEDERRTAFRTLLAEEARMGMMVGVAVGWALRDELNEPNQED
jgi:hypothetical protein